MRHSAPFKSNSVHSAWRSSPGRTKTNGANFSAISVAGCPAGRNGVAKDLAAALSGAVRGLVLAALFQAAEHIQQFQVRELGDGSLADEREQQIVDGPSRLDRSPGCKCVALACKPFKRDLAERIRQGMLLRLLLNRRIYAISEQPAGSVPFVTCALESGVRILADDEEPLSWSEVVFEAS